MKLPLEILMIRLFEQFPFRVFLFTVMALTLVYATQSTQAASDIVLYASEASVKPGWNVVADSTAAGGARLANSDLGVPKLAYPLANPALYFEMSFNAEANTAYRLWIRGKAANNDWANDSVFAQFSGSVNASGAAVFRIGSTDATVINLEDCS